jgi:predicted DNA-binding transcriptional regulator AlpA
MSTPSMVTIADVAHRLGVTTSTVRAYMAREQMPAATGRIGRTPYWAPDDIEPWLTERVGARYTQT